MPIERDAVSANLTALRRQKFVLGFAAGKQQCSRKSPPAASRCAFKSSIMGYRRRRAAFGGRAELRKRAYSLMLGLLVIFVLLAVGFTAGYGTRELISRKRHAEYLKFQPYISPSSRRKQPSAYPVEPADQGNSMRDASPAPPVESRRANRDIIRSKPAGANLHLVQARREEPDVRPSRPATVEESLKELVALLQRRRHES
jgi:hypothetical protein